MHTGSLFRHTYGESIIIGYLAFILLPSAGCKFQGTDLSNSRSVSDKSILPKEGQMGHTNWFKKGLSVTLMSAMMMGPLWLVIRQGNFF